ncbi:MAG: hypothetical protein AAF900_02325 [Bacteroidota bacterium]
MNDLLKAMKRGILGYLMLMLCLSSTIQATTPAQQLADIPASCDYILQRSYPEQVSRIQDKTYLDVEKILEELAEIVMHHTKSHAHLPQLLAVVTHDPITQDYCKYLFASNGLLQGRLAQQKAYSLNYYLVKAPAEPVIWQVLSLLNQKPYLEIKALILPKDTHLCLSCGYMCMHLFDKLPTHKKGCQGQGWPKIALTPGVIETFYSSRFSDQQRQMTINLVGDIFSRKASLKSLQPIQPVTMQNQLHRAVQLQFPIAVIETLLTSPSKIKINALDSVGKTPLDYAPQGSNLYSLLVRYNAKTSQQLKQHQASTSSFAIEAHKAVRKYPQPLIVIDWQCFYTSIIMGYLLPVKQETDKVEARIEQLFGNPLSYYLNELHRGLQNPTHSYVHSDAFKLLVTVFIDRMKIKKGTGGSPQQLQTIANKLKVNIQVHYPDPSNLTNLVQSDLTKPAEAISDITIHIARDSVHPVGGLTQAEKALAVNDRPYECSWLKYREKQVNSVKLDGYLTLCTACFYQLLTSKPLIAMYTNFNKLFSHLEVTFAFVTLLICLFKFSIEINSKHLLNAEIQKCILIS